MTTIIGSQKIKNIIKLDNKEFSGAGVLFYTDEGIILAHQIYKTILSRKPTYEEFGGGNHESTDLLDTAIDETREETGNLIHLNKKILKKASTIDIPTKDKRYYRIYFVKVENFPFEEFKNNVKMLAGNPNVKNFYKEVNSLTTVPFQNLKTGKEVNREYEYFGKGIIKDKRLIVKNENDKLIEISGRLNTALKKVNKDIYKRNTLINFSKSKKEKINSGPFKGTFQITV